MSSMSQRCLCFAATKEDSDSDDGPPQKNTSDKDEPSDLLTGLSRGQVTALRTTRSEGPHPPPTAFAASIESAVDPWMQAASASGREQHVAHDSIGGMGHDEHKACRSLMHRCVWTFPNALAFADSVCGTTRLHAYMVSLRSCYFLPKLPSSPSRACERPEWVLSHPMNIAARKSINMHHEHKHRRHCFTQDMPK